MTRYQSAEHDCRIELKERNLKVTAARLAVLQLLEKTTKPLDMASIISYLRTSNIDADPATAFRIINQFTDKGLTKKIELLEGKFRYELSNQLEHHHLFCEGCGEIEDISDCSISDLEKEIEEKKNFKVKSHSLEFFGICNSCQKENK